jgi:hypothetical protein
MLLMTVLSVREALDFAGVEGEIVIVDNSDAAMKPALNTMLAGVIKDGKVRVFHEPSFSAAKAIDRCHREAAGEFLFYTDAHCLVGYDTVKRLLDFYEANDKGKMAFLHAPIQWAHQSKQRRLTHFTTKDSKLGSWAGSRMPKEPRKVTWKGMPYLIRRSVYLAIDGYGCCAEHGLGWGIMYYLGPKPWLLGYENWAIPEGVSYHFGEWPEVMRPFTKYRTYANKNLTKAGSPIAVACYVYGGEPLLKNEYENYPLLRKNFQTYKDALATAKKYGEKERQIMQRRMVITYDELLKQAPWGDDLK